MKKGDKVKIKFGDENLIGYLDIRIDDYRGKGWKVNIPKRGFMLYPEEKIIKL